MSAAPPTPLQLWGGLALWAAAAAALALAYGPRWDEHVEFAQTLTGAVAYPEAHPYPRALRNALNLQIAASWLMLDWTHSTAAVCAVRNVCYMAASTLPVYAITLALTKRGLFAHAAAALALAGAANAFDSVYPIHAWPLFNSTGHVGRGYALLIVGLMLCQRRAAGALLAGLLPAMHAAHVPLLFGWLALISLYSVFAHGWRAIRLPLALFVIGLSLNAAFTYGASYFSLTEPTAGPYASDAPMWPIWRGFLEGDAHRALPGGAIDYTNSVLAVLAALSLASGLLWRQWGNGCAWTQPAAVTLYIVCAGALVYGLIAVHMVLREAMPYLFVASMPYRLTNHVAIIWMPVCLACIALTAPRAALWLAALLALAAVNVLAAVTLDTAFVQRYLEDGSAVMFFATGIAFAALANGLYREQRLSIPWSAGAVLVWMVVALNHQFGFACMLAGAAIVLATQRMERMRRFQLVPAMAHGALALLLAALAAKAFLQSAPLVMTPDERDLAAWLAQHTDDGHAMLAARPDQYSLQAKTGQPYLMDGPLPPWIPYMPSIGPSIQAITAAWYGKRYDQKPHPQHNWKHVWRERSAEDWRALADTWNVPYAWAPNDVPLDAEPV